MIELQIFTLTVALFYLYMDKKEIFGTGKVESYNLRCYKCNHEFQKNLTINDNISELTCPSCNQNSVELDL